MCCAYAGRLELHSRAVLERALTVDLLQHAYYVSSYGFGLVHTRLGSNVDLADLPRREVVPLHQLQQRHGSHCGCILMGIGYGHPLYPYAADQLGWIDVPGCGKLPGGREI